MGNYYLYLIGRFLVKIVPLRVAYTFAEFVSDMHYRFSNTDRRCVEENLKVVLNSSQVDPKLVREVFRNFGRYLADFFTMTKYVNKEYVGTNIEVVNIEYLNDVLREGKGGIIVSAHIGNWEMGGALLPLLGYPLSVIALSHKDPRVNQIFNDQREHFGSTVIQANMAVRRSIEHLRMNRLVAILAERDFGNHGIVMDFLGKPTMIPRGAAMFSIKTGAPIVPGFFMRIKDNHFKIVFYPPINPPVIKGEISDEVLKEYISQYLPFIEKEIKKQPSQWLMFKEFWHQA